MKYDTVQHSQPSWSRWDAPPDTELGCWSREVVVFTNLGNIFCLGYFGTKTGGTWQCPTRFKEGERVEFWIDKPH